MTLVALDAHGLGECRSGKGAIQGWQAPAQQKPGTQHEAKHKNQRQHTDFSQESGQEISPG